MRDGKEVAKQEKKVAVEAPTSFSHQLFSNYSHATAFSHFAEKDPALLTILQETVKQCPWEPKETTIEDTHRGAMHPDTVFRSLLRTIVYQQLSDKSARAIHQRVVALFKLPDCPTPEEALALPDTGFREAGLSQRKVRHPLLPGKKRSF